MDVTDQNLGQVDDLLAVHKVVSGASAGKKGKRHYMLKTVNRAMVVFAVAAWEKYVEDVAKEGPEHMLANVAAICLPVPLRRSSAAYLRNIASLGDNEQKLHEWYALAGNGYVTVCTDWLANKIEGFHTPSSEGVERLLKCGIGLDIELNSLSWQKRKNPGDYLDKTVLVSRHETVHTTTSSTGDKKPESEGYRDFLRRLAEELDSAIESYLESLCGTKPW